MDAAVQGYGLLGHDLKRLSGNHLILSMHQKDRDRGMLASCLLLDRLRVGCMAFDESLVCILDALLRSVEVAVTCLLYCLHV